MFRPGLFPAEIPICVKQLIFGAIWIITRLKWVSDSRCLPLQPRDWPLFLDIHVVSLIRTRRMPHLKNPQSLNDQIRWGMLFSQDIRTPMLVDKLGVRGFVADRIGSRYLVPLKSSGTLEEVVPALVGQRGVIKCTHDSGSAVIVDNPSPADIELLRKRFGRALSRSYGEGKGEWPYGLVVPQVLFEELLPGTLSGVSPPDVKVHCVNGIPAVFEIITNRQCSPRSGLFLPNGQKLDFLLRDDMAALERFPIREVISLAEKPASALAEGLSYVRVDFYYASKKLFFGEMTFFPESGLYSAASSAQAGRIISIPCDAPLLSIYDSETRTLCPESIES